MLPLKELLTNYFLSHQALPAFNIDSFEIYQAVEAAVVNTKLPCIVQLSQSADKFVTAEKLYLLVKKANLEGLPIYLNLDHQSNVDRLRAMSQLFDMLHFDSSKEDFSKSLAVTADLISSLKKLNPALLIETEFTPIIATAATDPQQAVDFINHTQADLLAVSLGSRHGNDPSLPENINLGLLSQIHSLLPNTFLVLHGSSGIPLDQIQAAIKLGIVKININTDLRQTFLASLRRELSSQTSEKVYDYFIPAIGDLKKIIKEKLISFNH
jgi:ketose-bisphosphate aldolase